MIPENQCPYCTHVFDPVPKRKTKCKNCGEDVYVRQGKLVSAITAQQIDKKNAEQRVREHQAKLYGTTTPARPTQQPVSQSSSMYNAGGAALGSFLFWSTVLALIVFLLYTIVTWSGNRNTSNYSSNRPSSTTSFENAFKFPTSKPQSFSCPSTCAEAKRRGISARQAASCGLDRDGDGVACYGD